MKFVPVPANQVEPLLMLYSQVAPVSSPVMLTVLLLVVPLATSNPGAATVVSMVIVALFWLVVVLPAVSVCLTLTTPAA